MRYAVTWLGWKPQIPDALPSHLFIWSLSGKPSTSRYYVAKMVCNPYSHCFIGITTHTHIKDWIKNPNLKIVGYLVHMLFVMFCRFIYRNFEQNNALGQWQSLINLGRGSNPRPITRWLPVYLTPHFGLSSYRLCSINAVSLTGHSDH